MGLEFARGLAARGYDLLLVSNREDQLASASAELSAEFPVKVRTIFQDLAQPKAADELYSRCASEGILPDVLVNDAGMFFFKELEVADLDKVQAMLDLHVNTVTRMCLLFGSAMKERGSGYILNVSSMAARLPVPGITVYSASKAYLRSFGRSLSYELKLGVRVGLIRTPRWLVRRSLRAMYRGRRVLSPAFMNVWLPAVIAALPGPLVAWLWKKLK